MKINYTIDENDIILGWVAVPLSEAFPTIEVDDPRAIRCGYDKIIDGKIVKDDEGYSSHIEEAETKESSEIELAKLKAEMAETDYKTLKYAEGILTEEEYAPIKTERASLRDKINAITGGN